jgi:Zn-dependent peptidase ImmA (M78 family)
LENVRRCDLESILAEDEIELSYSETTNPGFAACLLRTPGWSGIVLPKDQTGGRRRFSIAHELGHFHIPTHADVSGLCSDADLRGMENGTHVREWEANDFAAELLMPRHLFAADAAARDVSVAAAMELATPELYDVSVMAAASRIVQTTREAAALVVSTNGRVSWHVKSEAFRIWLPQSKDRLHHDTLAAAGFRRVEDSEQPLRVPIAAWHQGRGRIDGELLESTYRIDRLEQIVSLLWHVDTEGELEDT